MKTKNLIFGLIGLTFISCEDFKEGMFELEDLAPVYSISDKQARSIRLGISQKAFDDFQKNNVPQDSIYAYSDDILSDIKYNYSHVSRISNLYNRRIFPSLANKYEDINLIALEKCIENNIAPEQFNKIQEPLSYFKNDFFGAGYNLKEIKENYSKFISLIDRSFHNYGGGDYAQDFAILARSNYSISDYEKYIELNEKYGTKINVVEFVDIKRSKIPFSVVQEEAIKNKENEERKKLQRYFGD